MQQIISIVSTQMQLVNSIEYIKKHQAIDSYIRLIVCYSSEKRREQIDTIIKLNCYTDVFDSISYISYDTRFSFLWYFYMLWVKKKLRYLFSVQNFDICIIGNYKSIYHRFCQYVCWRNNHSVHTVLVDDGTATADSVVLRQQEKKKHVIQIPGLSRYLKIIYLLLDHSFKSFIPNHLTFFSIYDYLKYDEKDIFEKCNYTYLKQMSLNILSDRNEYDLAIIGQPLGKEGILKKERYCNVINDFINSMCKDCSIIYIPHPVEDTMESLTPTLREKFHIERPGVPFEMWIISSSIKSVVGYYSSALINIRILCPDISVNSLYPKEIKESSSLFLQEAREAYSYQKQIGINVIEA